MIRVTVFAAVVLVIGAMATVPSVCVAQSTDEDMRVFDGMVTAVDTADSTLTVQGGTSITFPIAADTELRYDIYDNYAIKLSDISAGDYVTVEYRRSGLESLIPYKVQKVSVKQTGSKNKLPQ
jgi:hypothetical protein